MKIILHTGTQGPHLSLFQKALSAKRKKLAEFSYLLPVTMGLQDHVSMFFAGARRLGWHPVMESAAAQDTTVYRSVRDDLFTQLGVDVTQTRPKGLILTIGDLWTACDSAEKIKAFLNAISEFSDDVHAVFHLEDPAAAALRHFEKQLLMGRMTGLDAEIELSQSELGWFAAAQDYQQAFVENGPDKRLFAQCPSPSLDQTSLIDCWADALGQDCVKTRPILPGWSSEDMFNDMRYFFDLPGKIGRVTVKDMEVAEPVLSRDWISKAMKFNEIILEREAVQKELFIPSSLRQKYLSAIETDPKSGILTTQDFQFIKANQTPLEWHKEPTDTPTKPKPPVPKGLKSGDWLDQMTVEAEAIAKSNRVWVRKSRRNLAARADIAKEMGSELSPDATRLLNELGRKSYVAIKSGRFKPRNPVNPRWDEAAFPTPLPVAPKAPETDTVLIGCMKDETPYILEWIAYHQSIGVGHFLIFTNDCSDGTDEMLERLSGLGFVTHVDNSVWKGKSPQQAALNKAQNMSLVKGAEWLIHIDVDEYMNIRLGGGTLAEVLERAGPDTTNIAMTWRLFGNAGIEDISDGSVMSRFTQCAPAYAPKPHTMWGFKTMTRNAGIYKKLSCHRPNQPKENAPVAPRWLNGSLRDITAYASKAGTWRSSPQTIGYDAIQLNHYALRSRESYLIKRQRGRALHTDRTIGLNYWIRHDWNTYQDRSILRHHDRMHAVKSKLLSDPKIAKLHEDGLAWHRRRAAELRSMDTFATLRRETKATDLNDVERVAYALAADMES